MWLYFRQGVLKCVCTMIFEINVSNYSHILIHFRSTLYTLLIYIRKSICYSWMTKIRGPSDEKSLDFIQSDWYFGKFEASTKTYCCSGNSSVLAMMSKQVFNHWGYDGLICLPKAKTGFLSIVLWNAIRYCCCLRIVSPYLLGVFQSGNKIIGR